jgi:beta-galactosidase
MNSALKKGLKFLLFLTIIGFIACKGPQPRLTENFNAQWKFNLGTIANAKDLSFNDSSWRILDLPHDWSIEGEFSDTNPATTGGGALPGGIGWYRKSFFIDEKNKEKLVFIEFDGIYKNSEVWINGEYLGKRPYGYSSFRYELTPYLKYGESTNVIAVKVDNSKQPNSRWYSGSGIYRNSRLVITDKIAIDSWGTFVTTPEISEQTAKISVKTKIRNASTDDNEVELKTTIINANGNKVGSITNKNFIAKNSSGEFSQEISVQNPSLWSVEKPSMYEVRSEVKVKGKVTDIYFTPIGIRYFEFDKDKGFLLNGKHLKILGVCNHHDLGCLGAAVNKRAIERQLEILKAMGCNGIRTSHNPPAPELLDLCDRMGFIVMDEAYDMWKKQKTKYDYATDWDEWHKRDLQDLIIRDRNHPCVFIWSIGNELVEQWDRTDSSGTIIARELTAIVKELDSTRPVSAACNDPVPLNPVIKSGALDLIGYNYQHGSFEKFQHDFPGQKFIGTETVSALATRGSYDMPSDSIRRWPTRWDIPLQEGNADNSCSAYDNCSAPWGSTHEETWKILKKFDFLSGMYIWTGFDYLGEPTPYPWPSRSSYFGIIDLAGFPKDCYYMYQSEWTKGPVLHLFPHWNWKEGQTIDVLAYTNCDEVELFLNDVSQGVKKKEADALHVMWRLKYTPGSIKAIGRSAGKELLTKEIKTAGVPSQIRLSADRTEIKADGSDLSFVTVEILDKDGTIVPNTDSMVNFELKGEAFIAGVDNGSEVSHEPFKALYRKAFNGKCLAIIQSKTKPGEITMTASSEGLTSSSLTIHSK